MWSFYIGSIAGVPPAFAAVSSHPPILIRTFRAQVAELKTLINEGRFDKSLARGVDRALEMVLQMETQQILSRQSTRPESLKPLLLNRNTAQLGLRRLNAMLRQLDAPISSIPISSLDGAEEAEDDVRQRPSWFGNFVEISEGIAIKNSARVARPPAQEQEQRERLNSLAMKLWNQQWSELLKEKARDDCPFRPTQWVGLNSLCAAPLDTALAVKELSAEMALAIIDDAQSKHLLANVSAAMSVEELRDQIRAHFPALTLTRIYAMPGTGIKWQAALVVVSAIHAAGVTSLETSVRLLRPADASKLPSVMIYGGELYNTPPLIR